MEQHFYRDEFEQMLKDTTEDFRMYPARKIWHSIYNDLHPDRKWPSFAVCLLLIASILHIGVSNNNSISKNAKTVIAVDSSSLAFSISQESEDMISTVSGSAAIVASTKTTNADIASSIKQSPPSSSNLTAAPQAAAYKVTEALLTSSDDVIFLEPGPATDSAPNDFQPATDVQSQPLPEIRTRAVNAALQQIEAPISGGNSTHPPLPGNLHAPLPNLANLPGTGNNNRSVTKTDKSTISWMEDFAFHNMVNKKKWKTNTSFQYYVTPSLGYRILEKNNDFEPTTGALLRTNDNEAVTQQAAPGFEAGAQLLIGVSKKLRFKMGLQYNHTNYITYAHELQHPSQATVLMNDMNNRFVIPVSYSSHHANVLGSNFNRLNNSTNQVSIPLGFDYKLAGNQKIKWYVGSTVQPSYIISGNALLISQDSKNFVEDASMLRSFNLNTGFETFVSFKTPSGIDINVGPQLRYQLLSTYQKEYTYTEKLYNLGVKIGVTKKL